MSALRLTIGNDTMLSALCFYCGTENAKKIVINFCFCYIGSNSGIKICPPPHSPFYRLDQGIVGTLPTQLKRILPINLQLPPLDRGGGRLNFGAR